MPAKPVLKRPAAAKRPAQKHPVQSGRLETEEHFRILVTQAPVAIAMLDRQFRCLAASQRWFVEFGVAAKDLRNRCKIPKQTLRRWELSRRELSNKDGAAFEECLVKRGGAERWLRHEVRPWHSASGEFGGIIVVCEDITARKQAEGSLRHSEERYRLLADHSEDFVGLNDTKGNRLYMSPSYFRRTGWTPEDLRSGDWRMRLHPEEIPMILRTRAANLAGQTTTIEHRVRCRDGSWIWVENRCKPVLNAKGKVERLVLWSRDITERKRLESEVLRISEGERQRVSADLHDGIRQELLGIGLIAMELRRELEQARDPMARKVREIEKLINETAAHTREVALGMSPVVSHGRDLMNALRELAAATARKHKVRISFVCPRPVLVDDTMKANELFRIAQEALLNAARHAQATRITLRFTGNADEIRLSIKDNGRGLPAEGAAAPGMGLRLMRYRIGLIQGEVTVRSRRPGGVEVLCRVPAAADRHGSPHRKRRSA